MNPNQQQRLLQGLVQASQTLQATAAAVGGSGAAGGSITVPALYLDFLPADMRDRPRDFFIYSTPDFTSLAAGASASETFTVQNDSDFLIVALNGTAVDPADETSVFTTPALTVSLRDSGSGREFQNRPQHWRNVMGEAELPSFLPYPKFIDRASDVSLTLSNLSAAQAYRVRVAFMGFKIFNIMR